MSAAKASSRSAWRLLQRQWAGEKGAECQAQPWRSSFLQHVPHACKAPAACCALWPAQPTTQTSHALELVDHGEQPVGEEHAHKVSHDGVGARLRNHNTGEGPVTVTNTAWTADAGAN